MGNDNLRIIVSGGGTGGHIFPAVSIANAIKELHPDTEILFVGALGKMEMQRVPAAGYDIVNSLDSVLDEFDKTIGLERLKAVHLNDSMTPFDSHKDRHAKIGEGSLGLEGIVAFINHPKLRDKPFYLETPNDLDGYAAEIALLRGKAV